MVDVCNVYNMNTLYNTWVLTVLSVGAEGLIKGLDVVRRPVHADRSSGSRCLLFIVHSTEGLYSTLCESESLTLYKIMCVPVKPLNSARLSPTAGSDVPRRDHVCDHVVCVVFQRVHMDIISWLSI